MGTYAPTSTKIVDLLEKWKAWKNLFTRIGDNTDGFGFYPYSSSPCVHLFFQASLENLQTHTTLHIAMLKDSSHALRLYFRLIGLEIRGQLQFRASFLMDVISTCVMLSLFFVSLYFILEEFENIGGWRIAEIAFLYGMVEMSFGLMDMIFSGFEDRKSVV